MTLADGNGQSQTQLADPTKLVAVTDAIAATQLPTDERSGDVQSTNDLVLHDRFTTLQQSRAGAVFRGVAFAPGR